jgi:hypothetical protein
LLERLAKYYTDAFYLAPVQEAADRLAGTGSAVYYWVNSRPVRDTSPHANYLNRSLASTGSFLAPLFGASQFERYSTYRCCFFLLDAWLRDDLTQTTYLCWNF